MTDFDLYDGGSVLLLTPRTDAAREWTKGNVEMGGGGECLTWGDALVLEPRFVEDILDGIRVDGLTVEDEE